MKLAVAFAISAMCVYALAQYATPRRIIRASQAPSATYLISEDFEGPGYEESWTESGTVTDDYATSPAPLVGSYSCYLDGSAAASASTYHSLTSIGEIWGFFAFNVQVPPAGTRLMYALNTSGTVKSSVSMLSTGKLRIRNGTVTADTTDSVATNTTYYCWVYYKKGTGTNGLASVEFSTTTTKTGSGNKFASVNTGSSVDDVNRFYLWAEFNTTGIATIFDKIRADDVEIGSAPE